QGFVGLGAGENSRWNEWLRLQGVEGQLLPEGAEGRRDAWLLRQQISRGRDQQHLLSSAARERIARLGGKGPRHVHVRAQSESAHHPLRATQARISDARRLF